MKIGVDETFEIKGISLWLLFALWCDMIFQMFLEEIIPGLHLLYESGVDIFRVDVFEVDLYLVHSPLPAQRRLDTWKAMEEILQSGKARAIGVSNYGVHHLKELFANCKIRPSVNQVSKTLLY